MRKRFQFSVLAGVFVLFLGALLLAGYPGISLSQTRTDEAKKTEPEPAKAEPKLPSKSTPLRQIRPPDRVPKAGKVQAPDCSGTETVKFSPLDIYPLLIIDDDTELGGKPDLEISAAVSHTAGRIWLTGFVTISEHPGGKTRLIFSRVSNTKYKRNFAIDSIVHREGCVIHSVTPSSGRIEDHFNDSHDWEKLNGVGLISSANCRQDTRGDDEGKVGCKEIRFQPIEVTYRPIEEDWLASGKPRCDDIIVTPRSSAIFPLRTSNKAHKDMGGHRVDISLDSTVEIAELEGLQTPARTQELSIRTSLEMVEIQKKKGSAMRVNGETGQRNIFLTAFDSPGCRIVSVRPTTGIIRGKAPADYHTPMKYGRDSGFGSSSGLLDYAICRTDTSGDDNDRIGCTEIVYRPIKVALEPE